MNPGISAMLAQHQESDRRRREKLGLTLGELIGKLKQLEPDTQVLGLGELTSYRGYYEDLAFMPKDESRSVEDLLAECQEAMGKIFYGYKGGEFPMHTRTPLWIAAYGESNSWRLLDLVPGPGTSILVPMVRLDRELYEPDPPGPPYVVENSNDVLHRLLVVLSRDHEGSRDDWMAVAMDAEAIVREELGK